MTTFYGKKMADRPLEEVLTPARKRMALLPSDCQVLETPGLWVPLVVIDNQCWVLPGVPELFKRMITANLHHIEKGKPIHRILVNTNKTEGDISHVLSQIQQTYATVKIGSYPQWQNVDVKVCISIEGEALDEVRLVSHLIAEAVDGQAF